MIFKLIIIVLCMYSIFGFKNDTSGLPSFAVTSFINYANSASIFYKDDLL